MKQLGTLLVLIMLTQMLPAQNKVIREGHRGCRGLMPENTIAAMKKALDAGVQVLELDVVISQDKQVVVSHDTYMSAAFSLKPSGQPVSAEEEKSVLLYAMPYAEIKRYDVGSKHNTAFARQQNFPAYKPLLAELIDSVDQYAKQKGMSMPEFNIEIKSEPQTDNTHHPKPQEFVDLVIAVCKSKGIISGWSSNHSMQDRCSCFTGSTRMWCFLILLPTQKHWMKMYRTWDLHPAGTVPTTKP